MREKKTIILTNGDFPKHPIPIGILRKAETIICCDGAVDKLDKFGMRPNHVIGDMDSISSKMKNKFHEILEQDLTQDNNDLGKAFNYCRKIYSKAVTILGATGYREDHSIGNIFQLLEFGNSLPVEMVTDTGIFSFMTKQQKFDSFLGQQVSLFVTNPEIEITTNNLKYQLSSTRVSSLNKGTLNESNGCFFFIKISHGAILVYRQFQGIKKGN